MIAVWIESLNRIFVPILICEICVKNDEGEAESIINPKTAGRGEGGQFDPPPHCGFSKIVSSKERLKPWFFATFNIILKHIFPENFIELPQVVQKI